LPTKFTNIFTPNPNSLPDPEIQEILRQTAANAHSTELESQRQKQIAAENESRIKPVEWQVGRIIWISDQHMMSEHDRNVSGKLQEKWIGPYVVLEVKEKGAYIIRSLGSSMTTTRTSKHTRRCIIGPNEPEFIQAIHLHREAPQRESSRIKKVLRPTRTSADYEVEEIVSHKWTVDLQLLFSVKWKDYPSTENSWEPESHLECPNLGHKYFHKLAVSPQPEDLSVDGRP
jgi:hypothetical protein